MSNLNLTIDYVDVPGCSMLIEDTYAEWLRLGEVDRAAELASDNEAAARQRQHGVTSEISHSDDPYPPRERAADQAVGTTAGAARPRSEEERQVGKARLNSDSSGLSPYSSSRDEEEDIDEYTASSGGAAARRVRQRAGARDAPSDAFGEAAAIADGATQRLQRAQELSQLASVQEMPQPRVRRSAAALAVVRFNEHLVSEHLGERRDQRDNEAAALRRLRCTWHPSRGRHSGRHRHHLAPLARCLGRLRLRRRPRSRHRPWRHQHRLGAGRC